ncbi:MAG: hypothetical protein ACK5LY_06670 [Lachnospirales bacterium]
MFEVERGDTVKKLLKYSFFIVWTIYFLSGILKNYKNYNFLGWIIVIITSSIPYIVLLIWSISKQKTNIIRNNANLESTIKNIEKPINEPIPTTIKSESKLIISDDYALRKQQTVEKPTGYIEVDNVLYKSDGTNIDDDEVPYLIRQGLINALEKEKTSNNPKFHRSKQDDELSFKFSYESKHVEKVNEFESAVSELNKIIQNTRNPKLIMETCDQLITLFEHAKKYCYKTKGGMIYFQDMWEYNHNSQNECFSYIDRFVELKEDAIEKLKDFEEKYGAYPIFSDNRCYDCIDILTTSTNISTILGRYTFLKEVLYEYNPIFDVILLDAVNRSYNETLIKANDLKTEKGRQNRLAKFYATIKEYEVNLPINVLEEYKQYF